MKISKEDVLQLAKTIVWTSRPRLPITKFVKVDREVYWTNFVSKEVKKLCLYIAARTSRSAKTASLLKEGPTTTEGDQDEPPDR
jgi:hypothetical protein